MNRPFAARGVVISLVVLVGVAALIWWLLASGRIHSSLTPTASKAPADQSQPRVSAPSTEKPASKVITEANTAIKDLGDRLAPSTPLPSASADSAPGFDVARVEPNGEAVIAGRAAANAAIELLVDGQVHEKTIADASGAFVFVPKPLPPGNYSITLRATAPDGKVTVSKSRRRRRGRRAWRSAGCCADRTPAGCRANAVCDAGDIQTARRRGVETGNEKRRPADRVGRSLKQGAGFSCPAVPHRGLAFGST